MTNEKSRNTESKQELIQINTQQSESLQKI